MLQRRLSWWLFISYLLFMLLLLVLRTPLSYTEWVAPGAEQASAVTTVDGAGSLVFFVIALIAVVSASGLRTEHSGLPFIFGTVAVGAMLGGVGLALQAADVVWVPAGLGGLRIPLTIYTLECGMPAVARLCERLAHRYGSSLGPRADAHDVKLVVTMQLLSIAKTVLMLLPRIFSGTPALTVLYLLEPLYVIPALWRHILTTHEALNVARQERAWVRHVAAAIVIMSSLATVVAAATSAAYVLGGLTAAQNEGVMVVAIVLR
jgi:hypothetical protein